MSHYSGSALYMSFGGTVITGDQRSVSWEESANLIDTTAGADVAESHITGTTTASISWDALFEDSSAGTSVSRAVAVKNSGTLIIAPLGTATGKPKWSCIATSESLSVDAPYDDVLMYSGSFARNGDWITNYNSLGSVF